jgi:hypothetical protein
MTRIDITGQRFGMLKVIKEAEGDGQSTWWLCLCDCGKYSTVRTLSLRSKKRGTKSCGCQQGADRRLRPYEALYRRMSRDAERLRALSVDITYDEFVVFTSTTACFYCTSPVLWKEFSSNACGYNLDRKDSTQGYTKDNLVVCCGRCNMGKRDTFTFEEWQGMTLYFRNGIGN